MMAWMISFEVICAFWSFATLFGFLIGRWDLKDRYGKGYRAGIRYADMEFSASPSASPSPEYTGDDSDG